MHENPYSLSDKRYAPINLISVYGIKIHSRYGYVHEAKTVSKAISMMPCWMIELIVEIAIDSQAQAVYEIIINEKDYEWQPNYAFCIGRMFSDLICQTNYGHNGIYITDQKRECLYNVEPDCQEGDG